MWNRIKALIKKELYAIWGDKKSRLLLIGPPIIQLVIFSFAATLEVKNISMAVLNQDSGQASKELIHLFQGSPSFNRIYFLNNSSQIKTYMDSQRVIMTLYISEDFSRKIESGTPANIQLMLDGRKSNVSQIVMGYVARIVETYNQSQRAKFKSNLPATKLVERNWYNPNLDFTWYTVPCLVGILSMLMGILLTALSVAREREFGTFDQLIVSPLTPIEILIGKTVPSLILGILEGTIILTAAILFFGIPFVGSIWLLYISLIIFLSSIVGIGLFISSISKTQQQAILGAFVFMMPAILLSGYATPIENMPEWLQTATLINPLRYFMVIIKGVFLKDMPFDLVWQNTWPLLIIAFITLTIAGWFFSKRLE